MGFGYYRIPFGVENHNPSEGEPRFAYESEEPWNGEAFDREETVAKEQ